jgi:hypothetical protein
VINAKENSSSISTDSPPGMKALGPRQKRVLTCRTLEAIHESSFVIAFQFHAGWLIEMSFRDIRFKDPSKKCASAPRPIASHQAIDLFRFPSFGFFSI